MEITSMRNDTWLISYLRKQRYSLETPFRVFALFALLCSVFHNDACPQKGETVAAPDVIPPATEEMQHPEFWISRINSNPEQIIMTPEQIKELNSRNTTRPLETTDINGDPYSIKGAVDNKDIIGVQFYLEDPLSMQSISGDSLRARFSRSRDYWMRRDRYDRLRIKWSEALRLELIEATNEEAIPDTIIPRYGLLVKHTLNRILPTNEAGFGSQNGWNDMLQANSLETGMSVAILHTSKRGDWYYVKSELSFGWIPAVNVAEGSIKKIRHLSEPDEFVVAVSHKIPVYADSDFNAYLTDIFLGSRLRLIKKTDNGYRTLVPFRREDGSLDAVKGWIKPDAEVSTGFQPFTQKNVIETIFRLLYRPYGWAGSNHERDCCGTMKSVYKTFGIMIPRWTTHELHSANQVTVFPRGTDKEVKYSFLDNCEPGITLCGFNGHIVMYLGKVDGNYFVIHQSGYSYRDEEGTTFRVARVIVNDTEIAGGANIDRFTEISTFKP